MNDPLLLTALAVAAAVLFDFINGFHDAANSIATIVATRVLKPWQAVLWAAFFNFIALFFFGTGVAKTVGSGMIGLHAITIYVILAGLVGAILWGLLTWWWRLPSSSSHALLGGYAGAAMCHSARHDGLAAAFDPILADGWLRTITFIIVAPALAMLFAQFFMALADHVRQRMSKEKSAHLFAYLQMGSSALLSLMHGANDAQKTAGIIAGALVASGYSKNFDVPAWALVLSYATMAAGTLVGGWRIVLTLAKRLTRIDPMGGVCAETSAALSILIATVLRLPVSTTQVATGGIIGIGLAKDVKAVRWGMAITIFWAWLFTIPAAAALGAALLFGFELISG